VVSSGACLEQPAGVDLFISSLRAIPARTTPSPDNAQDLTENGSSLPRSSASPASAGLILSSERTSRGTPTDSLRPSSRHWSDWATALRQEYSARPKPEIPCGASDCSSWPSPDTQNIRDGSTLRQITLDAMERGSRRGVSLHHEAEHWNSPRTITGGAESGERKKDLGRTESGGGDLQAQVMNWSSPKASDPEKAGPNMRGSKGDVPLPGQAANWPGPMAHEARLGYQQRPEHLVGSQQSLWTIAVDWTDSAFLPPSSPNQATASDGSTSSTAGPNSNQHSVKRKLNPIFVEALMRWPTGLSGFERQETAWTRWLLLMPSFVSALASQKPEQQGTLL
jgi:hypothetical protein